MGAFLTFALDEGGSLVHVDDVSKGMKCGCHCPHCDAPLYAKNAGQIREHHFAHATDTNVKKTIAFSLFRYIEPALLP